MTIYHAMDADGAFIAGDTRTGLTGYAYPSSPRARRALTTPASQAEKMVAADGQWMRIDAPASYLCRQYDERNWGKLAMLVL